MKARFAIISKKELKSEVLPKDRTLYDAVIVENGERKEVFLLVVESMDGVLVMDKHFNPQNMPFDIQQQLSNKEVQYEYGRNFTFPHVTRERDIRAVLSIITSAS